MLGLVKRSDAPNNAGLEELEPLPPLVAGEVEVSVEVSGICGTDLHILAGEYVVKPPVVMGHEFCGLVSEVASDVDESWIGQRVVGETYYSTCGSCNYCRTGKTNLCAERRSIGTHLNGAFAPKLRLPAANLHKVPESVSTKKAALAEPLACVANAMLIQTRAVNAGDKVLVVGPGTIGLIAARIAAYAGGEVTVLGTLEDAARLSLAKLGGASVCVAGEDAHLKDAFDVVIECSGAARGIASGLNAVLKGGRFVVIGLTGGSIEFDYNLLCIKQLFVTSAFASTPASWQVAMRLLPQLDLEPLVSGEGPISQWRELFDASQRRDGAKFLIRPQLI